MADYQFNCPHCQQSLEAPEEMLGQTIECPSCNKSIQLPDPEATVPERPPARPEPKLPPPPLPQNKNRNCPFCGESILASAIKCKHCGEFLDGQKLNVPSAPPPTAVPPQKKQTAGIPACQQCGGAMKKTVVSSGNCAGIVVALIVFCVGIVIAVAIPVIGWIIGPIICIGALFMGGKRSKVWKCTKCSSVVNRA
ncbi:MAG: hypothetical protein K9N49_05060 [Candidatus Marinimicrobia bacterium]|nr:hypothetical protein [Candidatus Neomarinimicrobiota bacterium]